MLYQCICLFGEIIRLRSRRKFLALLMLLLGCTRKRKLTDSLNHGMLNHVRLMWKWKLTSYKGLTYNLQTYKGIGQHLKMEDLPFLETQTLSPLINIFKAV